MCALLVHACINLYAPVQISNFNFHKQEFWQESWVAQIQQVQLHELGLKGVHAGKISKNCINLV